MIAQTCYETCEAVVPGIHARNEACFVGNRKAFADRSLVTRAKLKTSIALAAQTACVLFAKKADTATHSPRPDPVAWIDIIGKPEAVLGAKIEERDFISGKARADVSSKPGANVAVIATSKSPVILGRHQGAVHSGLASIKEAAVDSDSVNSLRLLHCLTQKANGLTSGIALNKAEAQVKIHVPLGRLGSQGGRGEG